MSEQHLDSIVLAVISKFKARAIMGKQKYGTDLDRTDLQPFDWIQHAQEELMDGILYLEKLKQSIGLGTAAHLQVLSGAIQQPAAHLQVLSGKDHPPQYQEPLVKVEEKMPMPISYEDIQQKHGC
jgi:hypothetical protein